MTKRVNTIGIAAIAQIIKHPNSLTVVSYILLKKISLSSESILTEADSVQVKLKTEYIVAITPENFVAVA